MGIKYWIVAVLSLGLFVFGKPYPASAATVSGRATLLVEDPGAQNQSINIDSEQNEIAIADWNPLLQTFTIVDGHSVLKSETPYCYSLTSFKVKCRRPPGYSPDIKEIRLVLGDSDGQELNSLTVAMEHNCLDLPGDIKLDFPLPVNAYGGGGIDIFRGGCGKDILSGKEGNDTLYANDSVLPSNINEDNLDYKLKTEDQIFCGEGVDTFAADLIRVIFYMWPAQPNIYNYWQDDAASDCEHRLPLPPVRLYEHGW